jgi:hypothetical protein
MCCDQLVCARCAGPVSEGRCATCRAARSELHHHQFPLTPTQLAVLITVLLAVVTTALAVHATQF